MKMALMMRRGRWWAGQTCAKDMMAKEATSRNPTIMKVCLSFLGGWKMRKRVKMTLQRRLRESTTPKSDMEYLRSRRGGGTSHEFGTKLLCSKSRIQSRVGS